MAYEECVRDISSNFLLKFINPKNLFGAIRLLSYHSTKFFSPKNLIFNIETTFSLVIFYEWSQQKNIDHFLPAKWNKKLFFNYFLVGTTTTKKNSCTSQLLFSYVSAPCRFCPFFCFVVVFCSFFSFCLFAQLF